MFQSYGGQTSPISRNSTHEPVDRGHQGPRWAAAIVAVEISDTSEETVNINESTTESVEETERARNTEKLGNNIMVSEIFI